MHSLRSILFHIFLLLLSCTVKGQYDSLRKEIFGFIRGGFYSGVDKEDVNTPYISSAFADLALKINSENGYNFKAYADVRFRYGSEFQEHVNTINIREGYVRFYGKQWDLSAGQQIVKWGRADFTNPISDINPQNFVSRSPDRSDMDMGNILADIKWHPSPVISLGTVLIPYYRSSVLIIDQIPVPDYVTINQINPLLTDKEMFSYGIKSDIHLRGIDFSISWFDGYDPMPGTELTSFSLDMSGPLPIPLTELTFRPYKTQVIGIDFESSIRNVGIRGEAAWSKPYLSFETDEYVPFPEIVWVAGSDISLGAWRLIFEYSGKKLLEFAPSVVDPVLAEEQDFSKLVQYFSDPEFNPEDYIRQQVGAFNRLYNYQFEQYYHSAGMRIESDLVYGKLTPALFTMYNFTSRDFLLIPEIKFKPSDGLAITAGVEYYRGIDGSLYDLVDGFMNSFYISLRVDF